MNTGFSKRILIVSDDIVDSNMGGVGVRNWELSHTLASHCDVTLAIPNVTKLTSESIGIITYARNGQDLRTIAQSVDVILVQGFVLHFQPYLAEMRRPLAVDLYVPSLLESLVWHDHAQWDTWIPEYEEYLRVQNELLRHGDFFFCASERQRDYWLGWLHAQKRINPHTYRQDPTLQGLIEVVPFGITRDPIPSYPPVLKGIHPNIKVSDKVVLWSGGLWEWLDPLSLIKAVAQLVPQHPEIKLYFMGTSHPNPVVSGMSMPYQARKLSEESGLLNKNIFFGEWTPYQERGRYLAESDLAVISHPEHIETHFSFRTRVLDCIWAGLPIISTQGDILAEWIASNQIGLVVPPNDVSAMADAILNLLNSKGKPSIDQSFEGLRERLQWDKVAEPLIKYCLNPIIAPDKGLYLTETERISKDKDAFLAKVVRAKDAHTEQIILEKDAFLSQVVHDKDEFFEQGIREKEMKLDEVIREKDLKLDEVIREKDLKLEQVIREKDAFIDRTIQEKDSDREQALQVQQLQFQEIIDEKEGLILRQQQQIEKYQQSFPVRVYAALKHLIGR